VGLVGKSYPGKKLKDWTLGEEMEIQKSLRRERVAYFKRQALDISQKIFSLSIHSKGMNVGSARAEA